MPQTCHDGTVIEYLEFYIHCYSCKSPQQQELRHTPGQLDHRLLCRVCGSRATAKAVVDQLKKKRGVRSDAFLFYGFDICSGGQPIMDEQWKLLRPIIGAGDDELVEAMDRLQELQVVPGVAIQEHCSLDDPTYFVYTEMIRARRSVAVVVDPRVLQKNRKEDDRRLQEFCRLTGFQWEAPSWKLVSFAGDGPMAWSQPLAVEHAPPKRVIGGLGSRLGAPLPRKT